MPQKETVGSSIFKMFDQMYRFVGLDNFLKVVGVITAVVSIIVVFTKRQDYELVVWQDQIEAVYPAKSTQNMELPLSFDGLPAKSAYFATLNISNEGKYSLGSQTDFWSLNIIGPPEATLILLDVRPDNNNKTVVSQVNKTERNTITNNIGLLQPRAAIHMRILVLNAHAPPFVLSAKSTLAGLPQPPVDFRSRSARAASSFYWVLFGLFLVVMAADYSRLYFTGKISRKEFLIRLVIGVPILSLIGAVFFGQALGWAVVQAGEFGFLD